MPKRAQAATFYTTEELVEMGVNYYHIHRRVPGFSDLLNTNGLASYGVIRQKMGGVTAYQQAILEHITHGHAPTQEERRIQTYTEKRKLSRDLYIAQGVLFVQKHGYYPMPTNFDSKEWAIPCFDTIRNFFGSIGAWHKAIAESQDGLPQPPTVRARESRYQSNVRSERARPKAPSRRLLPQEDLPSTEETTANYTPPLGYSEDGKCLCAACMAPIRPACTCAPGGKACPACAAYTPWLPSEVTAYLRA
jgi:hypothetical protein